MKICPNCNNQAADEAMFCTSCGRSLGVESAPAQVAPTQESPAQAAPAQEAPAQEAPTQAAPVPVQHIQNYTPQSPSYDHTSEFDAQDISDNKVIAMLCYLSSFFGILIAVIAARQSPYTMFHARQSMKFIVVETFMALACVLLCWTIIVPIAVGIMTLVFLIIRFIVVFQIGKGKAIEPAIIRGIGFLK